MELVNNKGEYASISNPVMMVKNITKRLLHQYKAISDNNGNVYSIEDTNLIKIKIINFSDEIYNLINKWNDCTIIFNVYSAEEFNKLSAFLSEIGDRESNIIIDISTLENLKKGDYLNFKDLPECAYVTNHKLIYPLLQESEAPVNNENTSDFSTWNLWLQDSEVTGIISKLLPTCKRHFLSERVLAKQLYSRYYCNSEYDIVMGIFKWCNKNIVTDETKENHDSVLTYRTHTGFSDGKSKLFKLLLNNQYVKIDCEIEKGFLNGVEHSWNVAIIDGKEYRFDITYGRMFESIDDLKENGYEICDKNVEKTIKLKKVIG